MSLPINIYSVAAVREMDRIAINEVGIAGYVLMTRAAEAAFGFAQAQFPKASNWQFLCGAGNNAGDAYVLARLAAERGISVTVTALVSPGNLSGDAATAYADFEASGGSSEEWPGSLQENADLLIDGLLGSGLDRAVDGRFAEAVNVINQHDAPVLSLDIPTGLHADNGSVMGTAVHAHLTVTFVGLKSGLFVGDGPAHVGQLEFSGLDIPDKCRESQPVCYRRILNAVVTGALPRRQQDAHKGHFGHLVVIGGGPGMSGAITLTGEAALRCGAGSVSVATHPEHHAEISAARPELMCSGVASPDDLVPLLDKATALVIGPGLGQSAWAVGIYQAAVKASLPSVLDADALNILAQNAQTRDHWVLTPHPGEASRLLSKSSGEIQQNRRDSLLDLQRKYGGIAVLKGSGSLVSSADRVPWISTSGNPGMAAPGMGDMLAGVIGALIAQGLDAELAAVVGVEIHARAGDAAARAGERGLIASDLMPFLRQMVNP